MRIIFNIALILCLLFLPWWLGALVLAAGCLSVRGFYEGIIYGILSDALYGTSYGIHGFAFAGSLFALIVFFISTLLRDRLAWQ